MILFFFLCCYFFQSKDLLAKAWGWEMLLPYEGSVEWSGYCNYFFFSRTT
uniref:Uncharacterized protein n=1 Tax=Setaria viridis TaxID=4556 RepID=A0A4U6UJG8_SETVI|nr:hypothetical protein SEVIR_6G183566v2 [Setaria viridis]